MSQTTDPRVGVYHHPAARMYLSFIHWIANGHGIPWSAALDDYLAGLSILRAAGWERAINAAIGFVDYYRKARWLDLRDLERDWEAFAAIGHEKKSDLSRVRRDEFIGGIVVVLAKAFATGGSEKDFGLKVDAEALAQAEEQVPKLPPEWRHFGALDRKHLPDPLAPYIGERRLREGEGSRIEGWKGICQCLEAAGVGPFSEREARRKLEAAGVELQHERGRVFVERRSLEVLTRPAHPPPGPPTLRRLGEGERNRS